MRAGLLLVLAAGTAAGQAVSYVASVKENRDAVARGISEYLPGGRYSATAVTLAQVIRTAYRIQPYQLIGAPGWVSAKRFDIEAKAEGNPPPSQQDLLLAILKERFGLAAHGEKQEMAVFALAPARKDGRLGAQLTRTEFDCAAYRAGPHPLPEPGRTPPCAMRVGPGALSGKAISMAQLAGSLGALMGRPMMDRTALSGVFDAEMTWAPETTGPPDPEAEGAPLITALTEQLGLKLVAEKGRVEVVVVDRIQEPSGN
jgi:uncharacterized protein (TIGR03435 family)